jgi:hypothetical protein
VLFAEAFFNWVRFGKRTQFSEGFKAFKRGELDVFGAEYGDSTPTERRGYKTAASGALALQRKDLQA